MNIKVIKRRGNEKQKAINIVDEDEIVTSEDEKL